MIPLSGTSGFFTRIGRFGGALRDLNGSLGSVAPSPGSAWGASGPAIAALDTHVANIWAQFPSTDQAVIGGASALYAARDNLRGSVGGWQAYLQAIAQATLIAMANDDTPLSALTVPVAMALLVAQMKTAGASVNKPTVSATVTPGGSNSGNAVLVVSVLGPDGLQRDYAFAETLTATCNQDSQPGSIATLSSEPVAVLGQMAEGNQLAWDWPLGSGATVTLKAVDANLNQSATGNLLNNSGFETWTVANTPDKWTLDTGTAGTTIFQSSSPYDSGSYALQFTGTGAEFTAISQTCGASTGTTARLAPSTVYVLNGWHKVQAASTGIVRLALVDGSNAVVNDANAAANSVSQDLSTLATGYTNFSAFFRTPAVLPSTLKLQIKLTTALTNTKQYVLDRLSLTPAQALYTGGPYAALFSASSKIIKSDTWSIVMANNYAGIFQRVFEQFFGMRILGMAIPSSGSPTISDSLVA